jgi:uncharacterized membrane protein
MAKGNKNGDNGNQKIGFVFERENYKWMVIGFAVIVLGFLLMMGETDDLFNSEKAFEPGGISFATHIKVTLAPIIVLLGFAIEIYAILKKPKKEVNESN